MPTRALRPCNRAGCPNLTNGRYCQADQHLAKQWDQQRGSAAQRGYDGKWQKARLTHLAHHPTCATCGGVATLVDHRIPHRGDMKRFWDKGLWDSMCDLCHNRKRQRESMEVRG